MAETITVKPGLLIFLFGIAVGIVAFIFWCLSMRYKRKLLKRQRVFLKYNPDWREHQQSSAALRYYLARRRHSLLKGFADFPDFEGDNDWYSFYGSPKPSHSFFRVLAKLNLKMLLYEEGLDSEIVRFLKSKGITFCALCVTVATMAVVTFCKAQRVAAVATEGD